MICKEKYKKTIQKNNAFKISALTWNEEFKISDGSNFCHISNIQDFFKHEAVGKNLPIRIYVNQIENKITFRIKI